MGAYLSSPICDQETSEESNEHLAFVASSMQGWRISQEDAHNAILNYDDQTSFFAVYDGHGGAEIARYCAESLPDFIRHLRPYKEGKWREALIEGFLQFDARLTEPKVKKILQKLAAEQDDEDEENEEALEENLVNPNPKENSILHQHDELDHQEETKLLQEEAHLPIEHLLQRFQPTDESHSASIEEIPIVKETTGDDEQKEHLSSSELTTKSRRIRKPVSSTTTTSTTTTTTTTTVETTSLLGQLISAEPAGMDDEDDEDDEDEDFDCEQSDDEEGEDEDEENNEQEDGEEAEIKRIMKKSILAVLSGEKLDDQGEGEGEGEGEEEEDEEEDLEMVDVENDPGSSSGCTAVVVVVKGKELLVANAGDSRCVLCREGKSVEMSVDHKPEDPSERQRIEKAGYKVTSDGRVSGGLNLSRAIGDHAYKKKSGLSACEQAITPLPDVRQLTLDERDEFLVVACDGIWNSMSSEQVVQFVRSRLEQKKSLRDICDELFLQCLAPNTCGDGTGCDNMTAIIVQFVRSGRAKESPLSPKSALSSSLSLNHKRSLSPSVVPSADEENLSPQNKKKFKVLQENDDEHERNALSMD